MTLLPPAGVVAHLLQATGDRPKPVRIDEHIRTASGEVILKARRESRGIVVFTVPAAVTADREAVCKAVDNYLKKLAQDR